MAKRQVSFEKELLRHLKSLSVEKVELVDSETGAVEKMTRAEALARTVWREALGGPIYADVTDEDGKTSRVYKGHKAPDKFARQMIFDHLLGKPKAQAVSKGDGKESKTVPLHERISESLVAHVNSLTENADANGSGDRGKDKAGSGSPISERMRRMGRQKDRTESSEAPD